MIIVRLFLLACVILHAAVMPSVGALCVTAPSDAVIVLRGDACGIELRCNLPSRAVSTIIISEFPLAPAFADSRHPAGSDENPDTAAIMLSNTACSLKMFHRGDMVCGRAQPADALWPLNILPAGSAMTIDPPGGGFHDALMSFLATISVPAYAEKDLRQMAINTCPACNAGFFIAEESRG